MSVVLENYSRRRGMGGLLPVLGACLLPFVLIGFSVRPLLDYTRLSGRLASAREQSALAAELELFLEPFGDAGPPTRHLRRIEKLLTQQLPASFEPTDFYDRALAAAAEGGITLSAIAPMALTDLELPVGEYSIHEHRVTLKGSARPGALISFLAQLHVLGQPVSVHACSMYFLEGDQGQHDFQLDVGVLHLSKASVSASEFSEE